ncbi:hypothetical protein PENPOL_c003G00840 [Penicillium polonicum]|uniref:Uncharacterized protein n=1 Tax=Penicillium polonicum TaxID=60169 RepID=A0A1V6NUF7_PENPO|nr:hypothetical protein PENPOL_c003G00840 [Penicillium polonicum]
MSPFSVFAPPNHLWVMTFIIAVVAHSDFSITYTRTHRLWVMTFIIAVVAHIDFSITYTRSILVIPPLLLSNDFLLHHYRYSTRCFPEEAHAMSETLYIGI